MVVAFPCKIGAPVTGITLSTRVGRLSGTHSDTGFQLNSISPMGRKVMELHGGESERLVGVSTNCWSVCRKAIGCETTRLSCKTTRLQERVWGEVSCKDHENKRERLERLGQKLKTGAGTQIGVPICFTEYPQLSSLAAELWTPCCPLPMRKSVGRPFVQGWTHTHTHARMRRATVFVFAGSTNEPHFIGYYCDLASQVTGAPVQCG